MFPFSLFQFNFVGRILGPQGHTIKELEKSTGCRIMVRGRGSMRDKLKVRFYLIHQFQWLCFTVVFLYMHVNY